MSGIGLKDSCPSCESGFNPLCSESLSNRGRDRSRPLTVLGERMILSNRLGRIMLQGCHDQENAEIAPRRLSGTAQSRPREVDAA